MAKDVKEEELEIARDQLDTNHHPAAVSALVAKWMGVQLTTDQLACQQKLCEVTTLSSKEGGVSSAADKLIAYFCRKDNISYVCLFDEIETDLITIPCLKNVLPLVQNDNYSEPKLVCRQLFSNVYEDIKSVYTFFQFLSQQISK